MGIWTVLAEMNVSKDQMLVELFMQPLRSMKLVISYMAGNWVFLDLQQE